MQVPGPFEYERATSVDHAVGLLDRLGDGALIVAGGHSLLPMMKLRIANPEYLVGINDLAAELGFADQAHLTRAVVSLTEWTPGQLRAKWIQDGRRAPS